MSESRTRPMIWRHILAVAASALVAGTSTVVLAQGKSMTVASYTGFYEPVFKKIYKPFEDKFQVTIKWYPGAASENAARVVATKNAPEYDILLTDEFGYELAAQREALGNIDQKIVSTYKDLLPIAQLRGNHGAALGFYYTGIFYAHEEFAKRGWAPPRSWADLSRPEFCKKVGLYHPNLSFGLHALLMMAGGGEASKVSAGIPSLAKFKNCVAVLEPNGAQLEEKVANGEYLVGVGASTRTPGLVRKGLKLKLVIPEEGAVRAAGVAAIVKNAKQPELAQEFLNWLFMPEAQQLLVDETFYAAATTKVSPSPELLQMGIPTGAELMKLVAVDQDKVAAERVNWTRALDRTLFQ